MSGLSYFDALGVRGVDRKPLIIAGEVGGSRFGFQKKLNRAKNSWGRKISIFLKGFKTSKSLSPQTIIFASASSASSRILLSSTSRQSVMMLWVSQIWLNCATSIKNANLVLAPAKYLSRCGRSTTPSSSSNAAFEVTS